MARIFISYSRRDKTFALKLKADLEQWGADVWLDTEDIPAGVKWSTAVQQGLHSADLMIVAISPDSMKSRNVEDEWQAYLDDNKPVIPVLYRSTPGKEIHFQLRRVQYIDFVNQPYPTALGQLQAELRCNGVALSATTSASPVTPVSARQKPQISQRAFWAIGAVAVLIMAGGLLLLLKNLGDDNDPKTTPNSPTQAVAAESTETSTRTPEPTDPDTPTPTDAETPTDMPTATDTSAPVETQVWLDVTASQEAANVFASATAAKWTPSHTPTVTDTPSSTPNETATYEAVFAAAVATMTATMWTPNPTSTNTPTLTEMPTDTVTPTSQTTLTPTFIPAGSSNRDWTPIIQEFNGIPMVYVPAGCFMMGSEDGDYDERPVREVCLSAYWIGQMEVTNAQYKVCVDTGPCQLPLDPRYYNNPYYAEHPVVYVSTSKANAYASSIGCQLPTEAQWEYAARGPEGWIYPWGNSRPTCEQANIYGCVGNTAPVDQRPDGASWVDALDMSGNVFELVAANATRPMIRGGSWDYMAYEARASYRTVFALSYGYDNSKGYNPGFRVVCAYAAPQ